MEIQSTSYNVLICLTYAVIFLLDAKLSNGIQTDTNVIINTSSTYSNGVLFARVGSTLEINCSSINDSQSIEWRLNNIPVSHLQLHNHTIQYRINKVSWSLNGSVLSCKSSIIGDNGENVTIVVGDLPSPPRNPTFKIFDPINYDIYIYWETASYTGHLPAYYNVTYNTCYNTTYMFDSPDYLFCHTPHIIGRNQYACNMQRDKMKGELDLDQYGLCETFRITVVTVNDIGISDSVNVTVNVGYGGTSPFMPTPLPPSQLRATAEVITINVSWLARGYRTLFYSFIVLYHAEGEKRNRTIEIANQNTVTLSDGVRPYTKYYIYLATMVSSENKSQTSQFIGPINVTTTEDVPEAGPSITGVRSEEYRNDTRKRAIVLEWEEPLMSNWQGKPSSVIVNYKNVNEDSSYSKLALPVTKIIPRNITITGLSSKDSYKAYTKLCNTRYCGAMGPEKLISLSDVVDTKKISDDSGVEIRVILGIVPALLIVGVLVIIIIIRKRSSTKPLPPLEALVPPESMPQYVSDKYQELDDNNGTELYTEVQL